MVTIITNQWTNPERRAFFFCTILWGYDLAGLVYIGNISIPDNGLL